MSHSHQLGKCYESRIKVFLIAQELVFITENYSSKLGEIDLIMRDKACFVFVEVRYRKSALHGDAQSTVTLNKQKRIIQTAYHWMQKEKLNSELIEFRFDVFAITNNQYDWIKNVFKQ